MNKMKDKNTVHTVFTKHIKYTYTAQCALPLRCSRSQCFINLFLWKISNIKIERRTLQSTVHNDML